MAAFSLASFSLIGLPLSGGFVSKWWLGLATIESGRPFFALVILFGSMASAFYFFRMINYAFFRGRRIIVKPERAGISMLAPISILATISILLGLFAQFPLSIIRLIFT